MGDSRQYNDISALSPEEALHKFSATITGMSDKEAAIRLKLFGHNDPVMKKRTPLIVQFFSKFINPLILTLIFIGVITWFYAEKISAIIIFSMILISVLIDFFQEYNSGKEEEKLIEMVKVTTTVVRAGKPREISIKDLVPGDIVELSAGELVPADIRILRSNSLFINQSSLTGESFPAEKSEAASKNFTSVNDLNNILFMGTSVINGSATGVVISTGAGTEFGEVSRSIAQGNTNTSFDRGIREYTWMMIKFVFMLLIIVFTINTVVKGNVVEALIFALAVAVGLTPEMLPMLVAVNLSRGAKEMAKKDVIVKHLDTIQNLGAMDILCTDKTGTLTQDKIVLEIYCDVFGRQDDKVLEYGYINSEFQSGLKNVMDTAILQHKHELDKGMTKIDEIPFDFYRRVMSVIMHTKKHNIMISKGAPETIYTKCRYYENNGRLHKIKKQDMQRLKKHYDKLSSEGFRVLAIAYKKVVKKQKYTIEDENDLILLGYLAFLDPEKPDVKEAIEALTNSGIEVKILTGDNELVTRKICNDVGIKTKGYATGTDIEKLNPLQLRDLVEKTTVFTRLTPLQKERIIHAMQENGHTVGFLGDGINDAPTLKKADVGISVNNGVDIAKESSGIILLNKNLMVLKEGVIVGRKTFSNLVKYIRMSASSNFGNMFSMIGASLFLPFLPMLPIQILLNNLLYDVSQLTLPSDNVDNEQIIRPRPWNIDNIKRFMLSLGPVSSLFDFATFGILIWIYSATPAMFQTAWFLESLLSQTLVIHIIRTNKLPFVSSRPATAVIISSVAIALVGLILTTTSIGRIFGFIQLPLMVVIGILFVVAAYLFLVYLVKNSLARKFSYD